MRNGGYRLIPDRAFLYRRGDAGDDQSEAVALADLPPLLPPEHAGRVEGGDLPEFRLEHGVDQDLGPFRQSTEGIARAGFGNPACDALDQLLLDALEYRGKQLALVSELMVERTTGHAGRLGQLAGTDSGVTTPAEQGRCGSDQSRSRGGASLGLFPRLIHLHTFCLYYTYGHCKQASGAFMKDLATTKIDLPGGAIEIRDSGGDGPLVVFVHGFFVDGRLWDQVWPAVAEAGYRCVMPNLPLGAHRLPLDDDADRSPTGQAHRVADLVEALGADRAVIIGNDSGGAVSQILTSERPELVDRLILTSADAFDHFPPTALKVLPFVARSTAVLRPVLWTLTRKPMLSKRIPYSFGQVTNRPIPEPLAEAWFKPAFEDSGVMRDVAGFAAGMNPSLTLGAAEKLKAFPRPVLIAWSADDKFFPVSDGEKLASIVPDGRFVLIEDSYTFSMLDQPGVTSDAMVSFLEKTSQ